jgi:hypothetical protein
MSTTISLLADDASVKLECLELLGDERLGQASRFDLEALSTELT